MQTTGRRISRVAKASLASRRQRLVPPPRAHTRNPADTERFAPSGSGYLPTTDVFSSEG
jgi:hypothetical protein